MDQIMKYVHICLFAEPCRAFNNQTVPIFPPNYLLSTPILMYMSNQGAI